MPVPRTSPDRARATFALSLVLAMLASLAVSSASAAGQATTTLVMNSRRASTPQGVAYRFRAELSNHSSSAITASVTFSVQPEDRPEEKLEFELWNVSVPAGDSASRSIFVNPPTYWKGRGTYVLDATTESYPSDRPFDIELGEALRSLPFRVTRSPVLIPRFDDITTEAGVVGEQPNYSCGAASGAAWADIDSDGDLDLFAARGEVMPQMWVNQGNGTFADEATERGFYVEEGAADSGASFADYDNDGDPDLFLAVLGPDKLYINDGTGHFSDVAEAAGVNDPRSGESAAWGDYDGDGYLDLFVVNYASCEEHDETTYQLDSLFHNEGDGTFTDVSGLLEGPNPDDRADGTTVGAGFQGAWFDYDSDGDLDLYLANDYTGGRPDGNHLWRNDGPGPMGWQFTDVSVATRTALRIFTMGIALADYDRDLDLDMALSNIGAVKLMQQQADNTFIDKARRMGLAREYQTAQSRSITWGLEFGDLNLDGWEDLYVPAGELKEYPGMRPNSLYVSQHARRFLDISYPSGAADEGISRGAPLADFDRDGRLDIFVVNQKGAPTLYRNVTSMGDRHWLEIDTVGTESNRDGCGTRVILDFGHDRKKMMRDVFCGSTGVGSGSDSVLHFGLGRTESVRRISLTWPSGIHQIINRPRIDRLITITEAR